MHVVHELDRRFEFPDRVSLVDGGSIGVHMMGTIAGAEQVVAIDIVRSGVAAGTICRLEDQQIIDHMERVDHVLQEAFIECLMHCRLLDRAPRAVMLGIEPDDAETLTCSLTPVLAAKTEEMIGMVLAELDALEIEYREKDS